jgi:hypothetical protein
MNKNYVAGLSKSGEKKQKASIGKGKKAYKKGEKLSKDYFDDRKAIGGPSLEEGEEEKKPGAISGSTTADDVIKRKKINLSGQGEAGTGVVTIPKGTTKERLAYTMAVQRRMNPDLADKLDALKRDAKPSYDFGSNRKPGAGIVYKGPNYEEDNEVEDSPAATTVMGDPSDAPTPESMGMKKGRTFSEMAEDIEKYQGDSPDEFAGLGPDGQPKYTRQETGDIDEPPPTPIGIPPSGDGAVDTAMDIYRGSAENYPEDAPIDEQKGFAVAASTYDYNNMGYSTEEPVAAAWVTYDGRKGEVREYESGDRFFVSFDDNVILRMEDKDSEPK